MWLGLRYWYDGHGAFSSTPILKHYNYCYLVFYYILKEAGHASLSVFIEESGEKNLTSLWSINKTRLNWKKKVLALPRTLSNYSVVFLGYFGIRGHYVGIDDIVFKRCDSRKFILFYVLVFNECLIVNLFTHPCCAKFAFISKGSISVYGGLL